MLRVGITYDLRSDYKVQRNEPEDKYAEFDKEETIDTIANALKELPNVEVIKIGNARKFLEFIFARKEHVDVVFNIAEGLDYRSREGHLPSILEVLNIPYIGSDPLTLNITLDKHVAKQIIRQNGINTADWCLVRRVEDVEKVNLPFPVIVKLRYEGTSKGLDENAVAKDMSSLRERVRWAINTYKQDVIVEKFIKGREFTVGVIGNGDEIEVMPPVQIAIEGELDLKEKIYIFRFVESTEVEYVCPARISADLEGKIKNMALKCYKAVECRDFGRIDIRVDENNTPYFLECNPLPSLAINDIWPIVARCKGLSYNEMLQKIFLIGLKRLGIRL
jgi:D-alanine-D-alanine ligase